MNAVTSPTRPMTDATGIRARLASIGSLALLLRRWRGPWRRVPHIPDLKTRLGLSDGALGLVLLAMALGAIFALPAVALLGFGLLTFCALLAEGAISTPAASCYCRLAAGRHERGDHP